MLPESPKFKLQSNILKFVIFVVFFMIFFKTIIKCFSRDLSFSSGSCERVKLDSLYFFVVVEILNISAKHLSNTSISSQHEKLFVC